MGVWASFALGTVLAVGSAGAQADKRPFTVSDSIAITRVVDIEADMLFGRAASAPSTFKTSPDGKYFTAVTRKGSVVSGLNTYSLLLFDVAEVRRHLNARTSGMPIQPRVLASFDIERTRSYQGGIAFPRWSTDSGSIAFIGRRQADKGQVYVYDLTTNELRQLTRHSEDVVQFDISFEAHKLLFAAYVTPDWTERNRRGYAVTREPLLSVVTKRADDAPMKDLAYYSLDLASQRMEAISSPTGFGQWPGPVALSPDGQSAVILTRVREYPESWSQYERIAAELKRSEAARSMLTDEDWNGDSLSDDWQLQFALVDMQARRAKPLLAAPISLTLSINQARWSKDSQSVLVGGTMLPLEGVDQGEAARRSGTSALIEYDLKAGTYRRVSDIDQRRDSTGGYRILCGFEWLAGDAVRAELCGKGGVQGTTSQDFRRVGDSWVQEKRRRAPNSLQLQIVQDRNTPPEIEAFDPRTRQRKVITDFNPQLRELTLGTAELFAWRDRFGREFEGTMVLPPVFNANTRYPVVIQSYDHWPTTFLVDGSPPTTEAPFAARALVNRGMLVVQVSLDPRRTGPVAVGAKSSARVPCTREDECRQIAMEGLIDDLDARGLIERGRVGLISYSNSGPHAIHAITFGRYALAAATIADTMALTPWVYATGYARPSAMSVLEEPEMLGASLWGDEAVKRWVELSPIFHLDQIRTPLRYEHYGSYVPNYWDIFAILKRHSRPVELIQLPLATHSPQSPLEKFTSQEGNVDWMDFWLNGHEDRDPAKAEQYKRWRKLRGLHEAQLAQGSASVSQSPK